MQHKLSELYDWFGANLGALFSVVFSGFMLHGAAALFPPPHILLLILYLYFCRYHYLSSTVLASTVAFAIVITIAVCDVAEIHSPTKAGARQNLLWVYSR